VKDTFEELKQSQYSGVESKAAALLKTEGESGLAEEALTKDSRKFFKNNMTCLICHNVAVQEEPVSCKNCERFFCTGCLDKWV